MKKTLAILLPLTALLLAACTPPEALLVDEGAAEAAGAGAPLFVVNNLDAPVCLVQVTSGEDAGVDLLLASEEEPLAAGANVQTRLRAGLSIDLRIEDCTGDFVEIVEGLILPAEGSSFYITPRADEGAGSSAMLAFISNVDVPICTIEVTSPDGQLNLQIATPSNPIQPGETRQVQLEAGQVVGFRIADCSGFVLDEVEALPMPAEGVDWYLSPSTGRGAD